ncbi:class II glutamine amidotransferase [Ostertagia ostertagi]
MCGLAGFLSLVQPEFADGQLKSMADAISYRGPDASGYWHDAATGIGLGHRRLSILDLSEAGSQPMKSPSGRFVIVFNGEIYNHNDIRRHLEDSGQGALPWRGHSDTETLLAGFDVLGIEATVRMAVGMFAFAVWDCQSEKLILGRDRLEVAAVAAPSINFLDAEDDTQRRAYLQLLGVDVHRFHQQARAVLELHEAHVNPPWPYSMPEPYQAALICLRSMPASASASSNASESSSGVPMSQRSPKREQPMPMMATLSLIPVAMMFPLFLRGSPRLTRVAQRLCCGGEAAAEPASPGR